MKTSEKEKAGRDEVYTFAHGCIEHGEVEAAAVAVICFEWLQRPENFTAGHIKWSGYRTGPKPTIRIEHQKTGKIVDHPLEDGDVKLYEEAEEVLSHLKRLGTTMILSESAKARPSRSVSARCNTCTADAGKARIAVSLHFDACRYDRAGGSRADRRSGSRAVSAPDARAGGNSQDAGNFGGRRS